MVQHSFGGRISSFIKRGGENYQHASFNFELNHVSHGHSK